MLNLLRDWMPVTYSRLQPKGIEGQRKPLLYLYLPFSNFILFNVIQKVYCFFLKEIAIDAFKA